jgi:hypothetical protein
MELSLLWLAIKVIGMIGLAPTPSFTKVLKMPRIATGSIVTKDVDSYSIVGGNPAKEIKKRFSDNAISMLLELKWWDWDLDKIKSNMDLICSKNISELYNKNI